MSLAQEKTIKNYIYQMRTAFSLQEVHENTDVPKTSAFRIIHKLLENGEIEKTGASVSPQRYRAVIRALKSQAPKSPKGDFEETSHEGTKARRGDFDKRAERISTVRQEEVEEKAEKLGISSRTVYRIEKRVAAGRQEDPFNEPPLDSSELYPYMQEILKKAKLKGMVQIKDVTESIGCDEEQAYQVLRYLETNKYLEMTQESQNTFKPSDRRIS